MTIKEIMLDSVDVVQCSGKGEYHVIFIDVSDEDDAYAVYEPSCRFNEYEVVKAYKLTSKDNTTMYISYFNTLKEAIHYSSNGALGVNDIVDIDIHEAIKRIGDEFDTVIAYSDVQKNS